MATELGKAYVQIIPSAKGISGAISQELGGEAGNAGQSAGLALVGKLKGVIAAAGIGAFLGDAINTGAEFDKSMSQVAATMGYSVAELNDKSSQASQTIAQLRDFAQEMGATTAFSATQASEALNYMALAGYSADEAMAMMPNVLNLAAAGSMDLALASDMVTDTQTALNLSMEETTQLVDEMAKTASTTNTSVSQLGDAMLTIGATARNLSDGMIALDNGESIAYTGTQSLSMALGVLADNGIKGSEGGTHLRNMIMSLTSPTDKASDAMEALGLQVYDANGEMRPFISIIGDLNARMDGMTDADKTNIISTIFNKTDIASVNALLGTTDERWEELALAITDADGAAQAMAETQLDNLAGDVTLFQSALEGVKIALSDSLAPALREVVQLGSGILSGITTALQSGDMSGLMSIGQSIIDNISLGIMQAPERMLMFARVVEGMLSSVGAALPGLLQAGVETVQGILSGITASLPSVLSEGVNILTNIINGILSSLPMLITTAGQLINSFVNFLMQNWPTIYQNGVNLIVNLVKGIVANLPQIVSSVVKVIASFVATIASNLPTILAQGILILSKLIAGLIQTIPQLIASIPQIIQAIVDTFGNYNWLEIGANILRGIAEGLVNGISIITSAAQSAAQSAFDSACAALGIESPAKKGIYIGEMLDAGIALGISDNKSLVNDAVSDLTTDTTARLAIASKSASFDVRNASDDKMDVLIGMLANYLPEIAEKQGIDVQTLYNGFNRQLGWAIS